MNRVPTWALEDLLVAHRHDQRRGMALIVVLTPFTTIAWLLVFRFLGLFCL